MPGSFTSCRPDNRLLSSEDVDQLQQDNGWEQLLEAQLLLRMTSSSFVPGSCASEFWTCKP